MVRLIDNEGRYIGVLKTEAARVLARDEGLDLVVISSEADPPLCKIMDYGRFKYEQAKQARQRRDPTAQ